MAVVLTIAVRLETTPAVSLRLQKLELTLQQWSHKESTAHGLFLIDPFFIRNRYIN
jgi:hypothetical protein